MPVSQPNAQQNPAKERNVARILYVCIGLAVLAGILFSFSAGTHNSLSPFKTESPQHEKAPDQPPAQAPVQN